MPPYAIMWTQKLSSGKVRFFERYKNPLTGKEGYVSITLDRDTRQSHKTAEAALRRKIAAKTASKTMDDEITLGEIYDAYIASQRATLKPSTVDRNARVLRICVDRIGRDVLGSRLTAAAIRASLPDKPQTYNERLVRLKAMLRWAYEADMVDDVRYLDKLKPMRDDQLARIADKYMERDELRRVLDAMAVEQWRLLTEFLCLSGLRIGEAIALTKADVDLRQRTITVSKTYSVSIDQLEDSAKTETSNRVVPMQDELAKVVDAIRVYVAKRAEIFGCSSLLFFPVDDGGYLHYDAYRQYLGDVTWRVLGRRLTPHACRHTMTSLMAAAGVPLDTISRRLGHADSAITKRIYLHITEQMRERDAAAVEVDLL